MVNGIDFIGINIDPDTAFNTYEGYYTDETLEWVKNKLNEIDPDGTKPVFLVGHLSAKCYYYGTDLVETMINGNVKKFYGIFKGHKTHFIYTDTSTANAWNIKTNHLVRFCILMKTIIR